MALLTETKFSFESSSLAADTFAVVNFKGFESLSKPYEFDIMLISEDPEIDLADMLQKPAWLRIHREEGDYIQYSGILAQFEQLQEFKGYVFYRARLVPKLWWLTLTRHNQVFLNKSVPDLIDLILKDGGLTTLDFELRTQSEYPELDYVCQYRESHLNFISRWMEREGIYYFFEQTANGEKMIITDSKLSHSPLPQVAELIYSPPSGTEMPYRMEIIQSLTCRQKMLPQRVFLKDHNYERPSLGVSGQAQVDELGRGEAYIYGEHFLTEEEGNRLAGIRAEELLCQQLELFGESTVPFIEPGYTFNLQDYYRQSFNREYLIEEVTHEGNQTGYLISGISAEVTEGEKKIFYRNSFKAIPSDVQYRPERKAEKPRISGTLHAEVDAEGTGMYAEIDAQGRYKVRLPFDINENHRPGKASSFVRMVQPYGGESYGAHFPLHKGTEVLLTFIDGDPDRPVISGAVPNPETPSPVNENNLTMAGIRSASGNQMAMNDKHNRMRTSLTTGDEKATTICRSDIIEMPDIEINLSLDFSFPDLPGFPKLPSFPKFPWPPPPIPMPDISINIEFPQVQLPPITLDPIDMQVKLESIDDYIQVRVEFPEIHFDPIQLRPLFSPVIHLPDIPFPYLKFPPGEIDWAGYQQRVLEEEQKTYSLFPTPRFRPGEIKLHFPENFDVEFSKIKWPSIIWPTKEQKEEIIQHMLNELFKSPPELFWPRIERHDDGIHIVFPEIHFPEIRLFDDIPLPTVHFEPFTVKVSFDSTDYRSRPESQGDGEMWESKKKEVEFLRFQIPDLKLGWIRGPSLQIPPIKIDPIIIPYPKFPDLSFPSFSLPDWDGQININIPDIAVDEIIHSATDITNFAPNTISQVTNYNYSLATYNDIVSSPVLNSLIKKLQAKKINSIVTAQRLDGQDNPQGLSELDEIILNMIPRIFSMILGKLNLKAVQQAVKPGEVKAPDEMLKNLSLSMKNMTEKTLLQKAKAKALATAKSKAVGAALGAAGLKPQAKAIGPNYGITLLSSVPDPLPGGMIVSKIQSSVDPRLMSTVRVQQSANILVAAINGALDMIADKGLNIWTGEKLDLSSKDTNLKATKNLTQEGEIISIKAIKATDLLDSAFSNLAMRNDSITLVVSKNRKFMASIIMSNPASNQPKMELSCQNQINLSVDKNTIQVNKQGGKIDISADKAITNTANDKIVLKCGGSSITLKKDGTIEIKGKKFVVDSSIKADIKTKSMTIKATSTKIDSKTTTIKNMNKLG